LTKENFLTEKKKLLEELKRSAFVTQENVMKAFLKVPREEFVPQKLRDKAYVDHPLPILGGQTISAPHERAYFCFSGKTWL
jgi:protein-L-isoaspartate(D-aspartate) O-methyltransferase